MVSERRLAANRANALKSTGPKTAAGKRQSAQNARRHGLRAAAPAENLLALGLSTRLSMSEPALSQEDADRLAEALVRKADIQRARQILVEIALELIDPALPPDQRLELARLAIVERLLPLARYEARIEASLRRQVGRLARRAAEGSG